MKKGLMRGLFFALIFLIFLSSGVFAINYGECNVTLRSACSSPGHIVMGLSAATSSHGEFPDIGTYNYVLCCAIGTGSTTCKITTPLNKIIGLSSSTNAHAEIPSGTNYLTSVCYEDFICEKDVACPVGYMGILSLSADTNAHIGAFGDYPAKICCGGPSISNSLCTLNSATWNTNEAINGQAVQLIVVGSGPECDSHSLAFEIKGGFNPVKANGTPVAFNGNTARSIWIAEWQDGGFLRGNPQFYFNASITGIPISRSIISSNPELTVKNIDLVGFCADFTTCNEYNTQADCESDVCTLADDSSVPGVDCTAPSIFCSCLWNSGTNTCGFGYSEIVTDLCDSGYTLCQDSLTGINYCYPGATCPGGDDLGCNSNSICETGEGCSCADCNGQQDGCVSGATCVSGACYSATAVPENVTCNYGFTLCLDATSGLSYCNPGNTCPTGENPSNNGDGICDFGEGCLSADCKNGDQDSCSNDTYCMQGMCSSVENPINLIGFGSCKISQTIEKACDEEPVGYKTVSWNGIWNGTATSGNAYTRCVTGGRSNVACPAQIQLPFFDYLGIPITIIVIALIYFFFVSKKKKFFKKNKKKNR